MATVYREVTRSGGITERFRRANARTNPGFTLQVDIPERPLSIHHA